MRPRPLLTDFQRGHQALATLVECLRLLDDRPRRELLELAIDVTSKAAAREREFDQRRAA